MAIAKHHFSRLRSFFQHSSVGLALIYWVIGFIMAIAGFSTLPQVHELLFQTAAAARGVVYLEQAYPRPKHLFPIAFAVQSVLLSV